MHNLFIDQVRRPTGPLDEQAPEAVAQEPALLAFALGWIAHGQWPRQAQHRLAFPLAQDGPAASVYWVDEGFGYALARPPPRNRLLEVAREVLRQVG